MSKNFSNFALGLKDVMNFFDEAVCKNFIEPFSDHCWSIVEPFTYQHRG